MGKLTLGIRVHVKMFSKEWPLVPDSSQQGHWNRVSFEGLVSIREENLHSPLQEGVNLFGTVCGAASFLIPYLTRKSNCSLIYKSSNRINKEAVVLNGDARSEMYISFREVNGSTELHGLFCNWRKQQWP